MSKEWKPGDIGLWSYSLSKQQVALRVADCLAHLDDNDHWHLSGGGWDSDAANPGIRPLVVIDPEDREQVERLRSLIAAQPMTQNLDCAAVTDALREFANPTPPRPAEPSGLGAVVEDIEGVRWVSWRSGLAQHDRPWQRLEMDTDEFRDYRDIAAVAVLFDGADQ